MHQHPLWTPEASPEASPQASPQASSDARPVALVTGAGSGIGLETALLLGARGYRLSLIGRTLEKLEAAGQRVSESVAGGPPPDWQAIEADISDPDEVAEMIDATVERYGRLDVLVNNAGWSPLEPIGRLDAEQIEEIFRINALGPVWAVARAWPIFERQGSGTVVNVSSYATVDPYPGLGVYGAAKASVNLLTKAIVNESEQWPGAEQREGRPGIRAFTVAPGAVETPLLRSIISTDMLPTDRTLDPAEVAEVIVDCITGGRDRDIGQTILMPSG